LISINLYGVVQTQRFGAYLLVKKGSSKFIFSTSSSMKDIGVDVAFDEWLQNFTTRADQAINGQKPWHGPREKSLVSGRCSLRLPQGLVTLYWTALP
jgi:hypothetical protein